MNTTGTTTAAAARKRQLRGGWHPKFNEESIHATNEYVMRTSKKMIGM